MCVCFVDQIQWRRELGDQKAPSKYIYFFLFGDNNNIKILDPKYGHVNMSWLSLGFHFSFSFLFICRSIFFFFLF